MVHRLQQCLVALIGALTLVGGLLLAVPALAIAPPGGIEQFHFPTSSDYPMGELAAGADGNVWFTENTSSNVGEVGLITPEGEFSKYLIPHAPSSKEFPEPSYPGDIAEGPGGNMWFTEHGVNDESEYFIGRVTLKEGEAPQIKEFPIGKGNYPSEIGEGPDGNMWFTESNSSGEGEIGVITPEGKVSHEYPIPHAPASKEFPEPSYPDAIAQGPGGYMWFTDDGLNSEGQSFIGRINTSTHKIEEFPIPTKGSNPQGIVQGPGGNMWFTEWPNVSKIGEIAPTGEIKEFPAPSISYSSNGIALGPDGNIWFTEGNEASAIGRITTSGEVKEFPIPTKNSEPQGIVQGPDGNMWFIENLPTEVSPTPGAFYHIGRLTTPFLPASLVLPAISGTATQGQALTASQGSWSNNPGVFAYQWQDCDASGNSCTNLSGETGVTHFLTAGDVGHTLRVMVSATDVAGSASAVSGPSAVVSAPPPPPPPPPPPKVTPRVEASMTWTFGWSRKFTIVESLIVHGVPKGGRVEVVCHGHGCPFSHHNSATVARRQAHQTCHKHKKCKSKKPPPQGPEVSLTQLFKGRHLDVGASISISVVKSGWIGKSFVFTVRASRTPKVQIECLAPGSNKPGKGC